MISPEQQAELVRLDDSVSSPYDLTRYNLAERRFEIVVFPEPNPTPAFVQFNLASGRFSGHLPSWMPLYHSCDVIGTN